MQLPRLRFSLRTLLIITVLVAIPSAWLGKHWLRTRIQRPIVAKILANGGSVTYDYQYDRGEYDGTKTPPGWKPLRAILGDDFFAVAKIVMYGFGRPKSNTSIEFEQLSELEQLGLNAAGMKDETICKLATLQKLSTLVLTNLNVVPETIRKLAACPALTHLTLGGENDLSRQHLAELKHFSKLRHFQWVNSPLDDDGLLAICELSNLESLDLLGNRDPATAKTLTKRGFHGLSKLKSLQALQMSGPANDAMTAIANLPALEGVQLWADDLTDQGLLNLATLKQLVSFKSDSDNITDAGLKVFSNTPNLEWLRLGSTKITDAGIANLNSLTKLKWLELSSPGITDASLPILLQMIELEMLTLREAKLTDQGLQQLAGLPKLKQLQITLSPNLTADGVNQLRTKLPNCRFEDFQSSPGGGGSITEIP